MKKVTRKKPKASKPLLSALLEITLENDLRASVTLSKNVGNLLTDGLKEIFSNPELFKPMLESMFKSAGGQVFRREDFEKSAAKQRNQSIK